MLAKGSSTGALRPGDVVSARYRVERFLERSAQEESYAVRALEDGRPLLSRSSWKVRLSASCYRRWDGLSASQKCWGWRRSLAKRSTRPIGSICCT